MVDGQTRWDDSIFADSAESVMSEETTVLPSLSFSSVRASDFVRTWRDFQFTLPLTFLPTLYTPLLRLLRYIYIPVYSLEVGVESH